MSEIRFVKIDAVNSDNFMAILNEDALRTHLVDHPYFDPSSFEFWLQEKSEIDAKPGCCVRAVCIEGELAGWCGIQPDVQGFEIAIVLSKKFWGYGKPVFKVLLHWASELGHEEILFHLLDSRPQYKALRKMSTRVERSELYGRSFTTYYLSVS